MANTVNGTPTPRRLLLNVKIHGSGKRQIISGFTNDTDRDDMAANLVFAFVNRRISAGVTKSGSRLNVECRHRSGMHDAQTVVRETVDNYNLRLERLFGSTKRGTADLPMPELVEYYDELPVLSGEL